MKIADKVELLRKEMAKEGYDAYIVIGTDPHMGEYVAPHWRTREFISGFSGSAGNVLITQSEAILFTDSRYFIQAAKEIEGTPFRLIKEGIDDNPDIWKYIGRTLPEGSIVAVSSEGISLGDAKKKGAELKMKGIGLALSEDLVGRIWQDRPQKPLSAVWQVPEEWAGEDSKAKIGRIREKLKEKGLSFTFVSSLDDIAWISNLRGDDIPMTPVFTAHMLISMDEAILFTDESRFPKGILKECKKSFSVLSYEDARKALSAHAGERGYYCPEKVNASFLSLLDKDGMEAGADISTTLKARKNGRELEGMRRSHLMDGAAFVNFLSELDRTPDGKLDENDISSALEKEREKLDGYIGPSFSPISGFAENGALPHYSAVGKKGVPIGHDGILVLDTGSHFSFGTTDITRTLLFGKATEEEKKDYTLVLKGHLALARQKFPKGTTGCQLDAIAKQFLWNNKETFFHGTGHGVGFCLNVHEGPERISSALMNVPLEEGMVVSDEPGVYKEGRHGIRIENLVAVKSIGKSEFCEFLTFETLTMVPYERELIDTSMLTSEEICQVDEYHKRVRDALMPLVKQSAIPYLRKATEKL